jgi:hypothetical protein
VSDEEAAIVRGAFEAMGQSVAATPEERAEMTERWFHPDVEYAEDPKWPGSTSYRGRDEGYREILGGELTLEEVMAGSDGLFARVRYRGQSTGADLPWEEVWGYHCRVKDGQLEYFRAYSELGDALAAAGVSSP